MAALSPYINFAGRTAEALEFYKGIFGGETELQLAKDGPNAANTPSEKLGQVFHAFYRSPHFTLMASDMMTDEAGRNVGNTISLALMCDSSDQLCEWFDKLAEGGTATWEPRDSEWGSVFAQVSDKYSITWMLNYQSPAVPSQE